MAKSFSYNRVPWFGYSVNSSLTGGMFSGTVVEYGPLRKDGL